MISLEIAGIIGDFRLGRQDSRGKNRGLREVLRRKLGFQGDEHGFVEFLAIVLVVHAFVEALDVVVAARLRLRDFAGNFAVVLEEIRENSIDIAQFTQIYVVLWKKQRN